MSQLSESRTTVSTAAEHVSDHSELARLHNIVDVTLTPVQTLQALNAVNVNQLIAAWAGYFVITGCAISPSATAGKLDITTGYIAHLVSGFFYEKKVAAVTAISTTISTLASNAGLASGQAVWVNVEINPSGVVAFNPGTAATAADAQIPDTVTSGNVLRSLIYIPYGATTVSQSTSGTADAKLFDVGVVQSNLPLRTIEGTYGNNVPNTTTLTTLFDAHSDHFPADSLRTGDVITINGVSYMTNATAGTATAIQSKATFGSTTLWDITTSANVASAGSGITSNVCRVAFDLELLITTTTSARCKFDWRRSTVAASNAGEQTNAERYGMLVNTVTIDVTTATNFDLLQRNTPSSATAVHALGLITITKRPT